MTKTYSKSPSDSLLKTLAQFRYEIRSFLQFSEDAALKEGLHPKQHQLLLQVAGAPVGTAATIAYAAERLCLRHNSTVELVDRSVSEGLLIRSADQSDKRKALLSVTPKGKSVLSRLSEVHARELNELAPQLVRSLKYIGLHAEGRAKKVMR